MSGKQGASKYFGLGQATFRGDHGRQVWEGMQLRFSLESEGVRLPGGLHAKNDPAKIRDRVYSLIEKHAPRIDTTFLRKDRAFPQVRRQILENETYLYRLTWYLHFKWQAKYVLNPADKVFVIAATLGTGKKKRAAREAIEKVCEQFPRLDLTLCTWDSASSWGLQVADYTLWSVQRRLLHGCDHYRRVYPLLKTCFRPWEGERRRPAVEETPAKRVPGRPDADQASIAFPIVPPSVEVGARQVAGGIPAPSWDDSFDPWLGEEGAEDIAELESPWDGAPPEALADMAPDEDPPKQISRRRMKELGWL